MGLVAAAGAPFLLFNVTPDDRALLTQAIPPIVVQQLVPITWKDKWVSMKPFLLTESYADRNWTIGPTYVFPGASIQIRIDRSVV